MRPVNLYLFTRPSFETTDDFSTYEQHFSEREQGQRYNDREYKSLKRLVNLLRRQKLDLTKFDGFYYSFTIPQIAKEFDLLKISDSHILNIELKSGELDEDRIKNQLIQNRHYLSSQGKSIIQFAYISGEINRADRFYTLTNENELKLSSLIELKNAIEMFSAFFDGKIEDLFRTKDFLVSPLDTPDKFLSGQYFLTDQQEEFKRSIIEGIESKNAEEPYFCKITGKPGTGKTLLLYDIAKELSKKYLTCIIHCGQVSVKHGQIEGKIENLELASVKDFCQFEDFNPDFDAYILDEVQRIYPNQLNSIIEKVKTRKKICIFGYDKEQMLSKTEIDCDSPQVIENISNIKSYNLSGKIRTNLEISDFIRILIDNKEKGARTKTKRFPNVSVIYANDFAEADDLICMLKEQNFQYISFTPSSTNKDGLMYFLPESNTNTHAVIGHEFDNVLMVLTYDFKYNENKCLIAREHPNPNYLFPKLFYQGITRAREKLAIIVVQNRKLFEQITNIFDMEK